MVTGVCSILRNLEWIDLHIKHMIRRRSQYRYGEVIWTLLFFVRTKTDDLRTSFISQKRKLLEPTSDRNPSDITADVRISVRSRSKFENTSNENYSIRRRIEIRTTLTPTSGYRSDVDPRCHWQCITRHVMRQSRKHIWFIRSQTISWSISWSS